MPTLRSSIAGHKLPH